MPKTPKQSSRRPGKTGALNLLTGNPGNKGGGRTPDAFRQMCQELASSSEVYARVKDILQQPLLYPTLYIGALKWASENGYGRPKETIEHQGSIQHGVVILPAVQGK